MSEEMDQGQEKKSRMDGMLKGLREFGHAAREKAEEFGKLASEKAEELTKLGKIKLDIHQLNRSKAKLLSELGELVVKLSHAGELTQLGDDPEYSRLLKEIDALTEEIAAKEKMAEEVADEEGKELTKTEGES